MTYEPLRPREDDSSFKGGIWISIFLHIAVVAIVLWTATPVRTSKLGDPTVEMVFPDYKLAKGDIAPPQTAEPKPAPKPVVAPPPPPKAEVAPVKTDQPKAITSPNSDDAPVPEKTDKKPQPKEQKKQEIEKNHSKTDDLDQMMKDLSKDQTKKKEVKKDKPDDKSLLSALDNLKKEEKKQQVKNKSKASASSHSGANGSDDTTILSGGQQTAIGDEVRKCYEQDTQSHDYQNFTAHLVVTVDSSGVARKVDFAPETQAKMSTDAPYRALANRARDAVLTSSCSRLPMPASMLGKTRTLRFVFHP